MNSKQSAYMLAGLTMAGGFDPFGARPERSKIIIGVDYAAPKAGAPNSRMQSTIDRKKKSHKKKMARKKKRGYC